MLGILENPFVVLFPFQLPSESCVVDAVVRLVPALAEMIGCMVGVPGPNGFGLMVEKETPDHEIL